MTNEEMYKKFVEKNNYMKNAMTMAGNKHLIGHIEKVDLAKNKSICTMNGQKIEGLITQLVTAVMQGRYVVSNPSALQGFNFSLLNAKPVMSKEKRQLIPYENEIEVGIQIKVGSKSEFKHGHNIKEFALARKNEKMSVKDAAKAYTHYVAKLVPDASDQVLQKVYEMVKNKLYACPNKPFVLPDFSKYDAKKLIVVAVEKKESLLYAIAQEKLADSSLKKAVKLPVETTDEHEANIYGFHWDSDVEDWVTTENDYTVEDLIGFIEAVEDTGSYNGNEYRGEDDTYIIADWYDIQRLTSDSLEELIEGNGFESIKGLPFEQYLEGNMGDYLYYEYENCDTEYLVETCEGRDLLDKDADYDEDGNCTLSRTDLIDKLVSYYRDEYNDDLYDYLDSNYGSEEVNLARKNGYLSVDYDKLADWVTDSYGVAHEIGGTLEDEFELDAYHRNTMYIIRED